MSCRDLFASILMACLLAVGFLGIAPVASAVSAGSSFLNPSKSARDNVLEIKKRGRGPRIYLPIAPSYLYYDYPYYYSRGYYPTHVGPGFVYYGYPYYRYKSLYYSRYGGRCSYWHRRCAANWNHNGGPGSARRRPHQSLGACRCL
jgi:hypothetical protein